MWYRWIFETRFAVYTFGQERMISCHAPTELHSGAAVKLESGMVVSVRNRGESDYSEEMKSLIPDI